MAQNRKFPQAGCQEVYSNTAAISGKNWLPPTCVKDLLNSSYIWAMGYGGLKEAFF